MWFDENLEAALCEKKGSFTGICADFQDLLCRRDARQFANTGDKFGRIPRSVTLLQIGNVLKLWPFIF